MFSIRHRFWSKVAALVLGVGCAVTHVNAQEVSTSASSPAAASPAAAEQQLPRTYINKMRFHLPLLMDETVKSRLREIHLFIKDGPTGSWKLLDKGQPQQSGFNIQNEKEGEYLFSMMMIDRNGRSIPADVSQLTPSLAVVVDMKAPQVDVSSLGTTDEGHTVQLDTRDANLDPSKIVFQFQTKDQVWRTIEPLKGTANRYSIPTQAATTGMIRVTASDLANNSTRRDFDLANLGPTTIAPSTIATNTTIAGNDGIYPKINLPNPNASERTVIVTSSEKVVTEKIMPPQIETTTPRIVSSSPMFPASTPSNPAPSIETPPAPNVTTLVETKTLETKTPILTKQVVTANSSKQEVPMSRRLLNQTRLVMEYQLEQVGASGVGRVEVWMTKDMGQTWVKLCEDADCKSPVNVDLPGEGVFGLSLVVGNGRGFGGQPPQAGEAPEGLVEVDLSKPTAELTGVRLGTGDDAGGVVIQWKSDDRNPSPEAVELLFSTSRDGSWQPIAKNLKSEGRHRWVPPTNITQAFVRMVVRDLTGNATTVDSQQPLQLDDQSRPRGRMVGLTPVTSNQ